MCEIISITVPQTNFQLQWNYMLCRNPALRSTKDNSPVNNKQKNVCTRLFCPSFFSKNFTYNELI